MSDKQPVVGIVMGSDSDWPTMEAAAKALEEFGVSYEARVVSAHRMPVDSLLSIVQMPAGVPVATVSIGGARNAGLLAVRILASGEGEQAQQLRAAMRQFQVELGELAKAKGRALAERVAGN